MAPSIEHMPKFQTPRGTEGVQHNPRYLYKHFWHSLGKGGKSFQNPKSRMSAKGQPFKSVQLAILSKDSSSLEPAVFTVSEHLACLKVTPLPAPVTHALAQAESRQRN